jgi:hypothetical protein
MLDISFCIVSDGSEIAIKRLENIISCIEKQNIPKYEILIITESDNTIKRENVNFIKFYNNSYRPNSAWITKKKNILIKKSKYEIIVCMHDYYLFDDNWYKNLCEFGLDWDIQVNKGLHYDKQTRVHDWVMWDHPQIPRYFAIPYTDNRFVKNQFITGSFWIMKRYVGILQPLNESLFWGESEDIEWSLRIRDRFKIKMNQNCIVYHNKPHSSMEICKNINEWSNQIIEQNKNFFIL